MVPYSENWPRRVQGPLRILSVGIHRDEVDGTELADSFIKLRLENVYQELIEERCKCANSDVGAGGNYLLEPVDKRKSRR